MTLGPLPSWSGRNTSSIRVGVGGRRPAYVSAMPGRRRLHGCLLRVHRHRSRHLRQADRHPRPPGRPVRPADARPDRRGGADRPPRSPGRPRARKVAETVDHGLMRSIDVNDPNGIDLGASWWAIDPTIPGACLADPDPVPAAGSPGRVGSPRSPHPAGRCSHRRPGHRRVGRGLVNPDPALSAGGPDRPQPGAGRRKRDGDGWLQRVGTDP